MARKLDFPPLLQKGWHQMDLASLRSVCVDPFPDSPRRKALFSKLEDLVANLQAFKVRCSLWVDGGMLTRSPTPDDMDVVLEISEEDFKSLSKEGRSYILKIIDKRTDPMLDVLFLKMVPPGHEEYEDNNEMLRSLYVSHFHWNWTKTEQKGCALIDLRGGQ